VFVSGKHYKYSLKFGQGLYLRVLWVVCERQGTNTLALYNPAGAENRFNSLFIHTTLMFESKVRAYRSEEVLPLGLAPGLTCKY
jgi:hypothetical protein